MAMQSLGGQLVVLRAGGYSSRTHVFTPPTAALLTAHAAAAPTVTARFEVTYTGFSDEAKAAFQAAVDVWSVTLTTGVPIRVDAHFTPLDPGTLGSAGPETVLRDFPLAPRAQTWYPSALANKLSGTDLSPNAPHINANFNSDFSNWYLGLDGETPADQYDLMSVVLHELGHGLGFVGSANVKEGVGSLGLEGIPIIYDHFVENANGERILDASLFPNPSTELAGQLQSSQLFFNGARAAAANGHTRVRLYAPITWEGGSSFSHFNEDTFPAGNSNSLMTPQIGMAEAIHFPGRVGTALLRDLGW